MFLTYIWKSSKLSGRQALDRLSSVLSKQCALYENAFGTRPSMRTKQVGNVNIGQVWYETGIKGWQPWAEKDGMGIVWAGVCENYLGCKFDTDEKFHEVFDILDREPENLLEWNGMFFVVTWDGNKKKVNITTAATECPSIWSTEGPYGWAAGSRAAPILEMTGNIAAPDMDALSLYLRFGYFAGGLSPFEKVARMRDRQQITIGQDSVHAVKTYVSLQNYLCTGWENRDWKETVSFAANRLMGRVEKQMRHSPNPVVLLTGGRDSRSIAAAAKRTGRDFIAQTSGPAGSDDVVIAARVARALNVRHELTGDGATPELLGDSIEQLRTWVQMTDGTIPANYSLHLKDFLKSNRPFPAKRVQYLHGLEPGIGRGSFYPYYPNVDAACMSSMTMQDVHAFVTNTNKNRFMKPRPSDDGLLQDIYERLDDNVRETGGQIHHWFELLLWRERGLMWGMDLQSAYSMTRWAWMPLFDRHLMALSWRLSIGQKIEARLLLDASAMMVAELEGLHCTQYNGMKGAGLAGRIRRRLASELKYCLQLAGISRSQSDDRSFIALQRFWESAFLGRADHIWREFIDKPDLLKIIHLSPQNDLLWRLLTVDFMSQISF